jgi:hypothetical protein
MDLAGSSLRTAHHCCRSGPAHVTEVRFRILKENIMKLSPLYLLLVLAATSSAGLAQDPPTAAQAKKDVAQQKQDPLAIQSSAAEDWTMVNGHDKGYVTKTDAVPNSWLALNFAKCDADNDGKVSQAEYVKCAKKQE